jgi:glycosyltransferase involved in cell wall biosynthesis
MSTSSSSIYVSPRKVSVIITCYNYGPYLRLAIESVLAQNYPEFEIIVVNDGSADNTDEIMRQYLSTSKIKYIKQGNFGSSRARNIGIRNAAGQFIAFLDADDIWEKQRLEEQLPLFNDEKVGVVYSRMKVIDQFGKEVSKIVKDPYRIPRSGNVTQHLFLANFIPFSSVTVRRECLDRVGLFDESLNMGMDWDLLLRISPYYDFAFVDKPLIAYRIGHIGQLSRNFEERYRCEDKLIDNFLCNNPDLIPKPMLKRASINQCIGRGINCRRRNIHLSNRYFIKALSRDMFAFSAYLGLLKNLIVLILGSTRYFHRRGRDPFRI